MQGPAELLQDLREAELLVGCTSPCKALFFPSFIQLYLIPSSFGFVGRGIDGLNVASMRASAWWLKLTKLQSAMKST